LLKEVHFTAFIGEDLKSISSVIADVVYVDLIGYNCTSIDTSLN